MTAQGEAAPMENAHRSTEPPEGGWRRNANKVREVYFARAMTLGLIKIGVANFALSRLKSLQTHSPDKIEFMGVMMCGNHGALEGEIHSAFDHCRSHGEWFRPEPDLLAYIDANAKSFSDAAKDRYRLETGHERPDNAWTAMQPMELS